jgi:DNA replicative helicase MCM subunit Mcm2 (Cdc46/Mcm family)
MSDEDLRISHFLWSQFFPNDVFHLQDSRLTLCQALLEFFQSSEGQQHFPILVNGNPALTKSGNMIALSVQDLKNHLPFDDSESILIERPKEMLACYSFAISRLANTFTPYMDPPIVIHVLIHSLSSITSFGEVKSSTVGQMVCVEGHVVRVSMSRPLLVEGGFKCAKCQQTNWVHFEDGIFDPPPQCATKK